MMKEVMLINLNEEMPELFESFEDDDSTYETTLKVYEISEDQLEETLFSHIHESFTKDPIKLLFEYVDSSDESSSYGPFGGGMTSLIYVGVNDLSESSIKELFSHIFKNCDYFSI